MTHGLFEFDRFYDLEAEGVRLIDWLGRLVVGHPPGDVHCTGCAQRTGCAR